MPTSIDKYLDPTGLDETVLNIRQITEGLEADMQNLPYARPGGIYPDMTVGAVIGADETAQWAQRESTGSGAATVRSVQGAAVAWNQLLRVAAGSSTSSGVTVTKRADGSVTIEGTATGINFFALDSSLLIPIVTGHKYLVYGPTNDTDLSLHIPAAGVMAQAYGGQIYTANQDSGPTSYAYIFMKATFSGTYICTPQLFDLTAIFGSGNEPSTVAEFEAMYPEAYYPYSAPTLKPVQISGIRSTDAQGGELDSVEWTAQTLRAAGSVADMLYSDHVDVNVGVYTFTGAETLQIDNWQPTEDTYAIGFPLALIDATWPTSTGVISNVRMAELETVEYDDMYSGAKVGICLAPKPQASAYSLFVRVPKTLASDKNALMAWLAGKTIFYALATPTTTPISPALPMTYKVQAGGSEAIIVPDGEVRAAPVLTVAEPVNAGG